MVKASGPDNCPARLLFMPADRDDAGSVKHLSRLTPDVHVLSRADDRILAQRKPARNHAAFHLSRFTVHAAIDQR